MILGLCIACCTSAQFSGLFSTIHTSDTFNTDFPREKIYLHYDKPVYNINDTLWLKGYIVFAKDNFSSDSSGIVYLEIAEPSGKLVRRTAAYVTSGIFFSALALKQPDFAGGEYLLRAYTKHMRNYDDSLFFESRFTLVDPKSPEWNLSVRHNNFDKGRFLFDGVLSMHFPQHKNESRLLGVLRSGDKILMRKNILCQPGRHVFLDTILKTKISPPALFWELKSEGGLTITLPVKVINSGNIDIQFLPESGTLIPGKHQKIAFKALDVYGRGIHVKGEIRTRKMEFVTGFSSLHKGMGIIALTPEEDESYVAILDNGQHVSLPDPVRSGTILQVIYLPEADSVSLLIEGTPDLLGKKYFFRASSRGISCAMGVVTIQEKPFRISIAKNAFPAGVCRFTLYNAAHLPVNERVIFIKQTDGLQLHVASHKKVYGNRDSVQLLIEAKNYDQTAAEGSFSIAVIDTSQVRLSKYQENILSYLMLSSELTGVVEEPAYYLSDASVEETDALMLTQGWVHYNTFFREPAFPYEKEFAISGRVLNTIGKAVSAANVSLLGKEGKTETFFNETETNKNGKFIFTDFPVFNTDSIFILIRALNKRSKSFGIAVEIDEPRFSLIIKKENSVDRPVYFKEEFFGYVKRQNDIIVQKRAGKEFLPEVTVTSKIKIKGSNNLNTDGSYDQVISPKVLNNTPKDNLLDILYREVPGFHRGPLPKSPLLVYKINGAMIIFVIDGYNIHRYYEPVSESNSAFSDYEESYLKYITAEEVAGIEIMTSVNNTHAYEKYFNITTSDRLSYTFVEITTYSGNGAFYKKTPGMYLHRPVVPFISKSFYSPKYSLEEKDRSILDFRSTLYWNPNVITDREGKARVNFFTSDSPGSYLILLQGTDLKGSFGTGIYPLSIRKETPEN